MFRTPLMEYSNFFLKCEHHWPGGSYKARGVETFLASLPRDTKRIRCLSAGNMARTLALLAKPRGIVVEALVPESIPEVKRAKLEGLGVQLTLVPFEQLWKEVDTPSPTPFPLLHPVDSPALLEGYGRIAQEILEQAKGISEVIIPIGVGGLSLGLARVLAPKVRVVLVENATNAPYVSKRAIPRKPSWVDAIGTPYTLERVREALLPLVSEVRAVSPRAAFEAGKRLYEMKGELVEGAAAVALAAATKDSIVILTGGNIDSKIYSSGFAEEN